MSKHTALLSLVLLTAASGHPQNTLRVPADFATIQAAFDAAQTDDTIEIAAGTFAEHVVIPANADAIFVRGAGQGLTIWTGDLDGDGDPDGGQITSSTSSTDGPRLTVSGISFINGGGGPERAVRISPAGGAAFEDCEFIGNRSDNNGAAISYFSRASLRLERCRFIGNVSAANSAVSVRSQGLNINASYFAGNRGGVGSGAVRFDTWDAFLDVPIRISNTTFVGNTGPDTGAVYVTEISEFTGCTFAGNTPLVDLPGTSTAVFSVTGFDLVGRLSSGPVNGRNNIVLLNETVPGFVTGVDPAWATNIGASPVPGGTTFLDPLFTRNPSDGGDGWGDDPATPDIDESLNDDFGDLRLRPGSPAIDAGTNGFFMPGDLDLDGNPRLADDPGIPGNNVDIGAYEFQGTTCLADVNQDGDLNPNDFNAWILAFNSLSPLADQNRNGDLTPNDFNAWILNFNAGCD